MTKSIITSDRAIVTQDNIKSEHSIYCIYNKLTQNYFFINATLFRPRYNFFVTEGEKLRRELGMSEFIPQNIVGLCKHDNIPDRLKPKVEIFETNKSIIPNNISQAKKRYKKKEKKYKVYPHYKNKEELEDAWNHLNNLQNLVIAKITYTDTLTSFLEQKGIDELFPMSEENRDNIVRFFKEYGKAQGMPFIEYINKKVDELMTEFNLHPTQEEVDEIVKKRKDYQRSYHKRIKTGKLNPKYQSKKYKRF